MVLIVVIAMLLNNEYLNLVEIARNKRLSISLEQYNEIRKLYKDVANELKIRASKAKNKSLSQGWLKDYKKVINIKLKEMDKILQPQIENSIEKSAEASNEVQLSFFDMLNAEYRLGMKQTFRAMFSSIPSGVVSELVSGNFYKDGAGLSHRIWFNHNKVNGDIDYIIQKGIAEKKSAFDLANDVAKYVNPDFKSDWAWKKVYPGTAKTVDYCAQRLARTSISHSYTLSMLRGCEINPFIAKIRWHSVFAIGRTCQLCKDRDGREYLIKDCPMDHPNGMCYQEPIIDDSLEAIGTRLNRWAKGGSDSELDNWYEKYAN